MRRRLLAGSFQSLMADGRLTMNGCHYHEKEAAK
jgi:hypothetical protein